MKNNVLARLTLAAALLLVTASAAGAEGPRRLLSVLGLELKPAGGAASALPPSHYDWPGSGKFDPAKPVINGTTCDDVRQRESPTCAFLSSLSAAAWAGVDLGGRIKHNGGKNYTVTISHEKKWLAVDVTFNGWDKRDPEENDAGEFWPALYQRAYLKAWNVKTDGPPEGGWNVNGTQPSDTQPWQQIDNALQAATGRPVDYFSNDDDVGTVAKRVRDAVQAKKPVVTGAHGEGKKKIDAKTCLVSGHAYTVVAADNDGVELRNPWGTDVGTEYLEFTKKWQKGKPVYKFKDGMSDDKNNDPNDGVVRLSWETFRKHFEGYAIAN